MYVLYQYLKVSIAFWKYVNFLDNVALVIVHPEVKNWLKYARFEEKNQFISSARQIYERAVEYFGDENIDEGLLIAFSKFEEGQREVRVILLHIIVSLSILYFFFWLPF